MVRSIRGQATDGLAMDADAAIDGTAEQNRAHATLGRAVNVKELNKQPWLTLIRLDTKSHVYFHKEGPESEEQPVPRSGTRCVDALTDVGGLFFPNAKFDDMYERGRIRRIDGYSMLQTKEEKLDEWAGASKRGTAVHAGLEEMVVNSVPKERWTDDQRAVAAHLEDLSRLEDLEVIGTEVSVYYSKEEEAEPPAKRARRAVAAGQIDLLLKRRVCEDEDHDDELVIVDYKVTKDLPTAGCHDYGVKMEPAFFPENTPANKHNKYATQLALYATMVKQLWLKHYGRSCKVKDLRVLHVSPSNRNVVTEILLPDFSKEATAYLESLPADGSRTSKEDEIVRLLDAEKKRDEEFRSALKREREERKRRLDEGLDDTF
jgi:hypothetical protein